MNFKQFLQGALAIAIHDYRQAKSDWYFVRRQMKTIQKTSLRKEDD